MNLLCKVKFARAKCLILRAEIGVKFIKLLAFCIKIDLKICEFKALL